MIMKKLLIVVASVFLVATIVMTTLFIRANNSKNTFVKFAGNCMTSYSTSIDYILCSTDYTLWNLSNFDTCQKFLDSTIEDTKFVREMGYQPNYNYIGN